MDKTEIGDGPVQDKFGKAVVETLVGGVETQYAIQAQPVEEEEGAEERSGGGEAAQDKSGIRLVEVEPSSVLDGKQAASSIVFETKEAAKTDTV